MTGRRPRAWVWRKESHRRGASRLMERYQKAIYTVAYRFLGEHRAARDVVYEVVARAYRQRAYLLPEAKLYNWVIANTRSHCRALMRPQWTRLGTREGIANWYWTRIQETGADSQLSDYRLPFPFQRALDLYGVQHILPYLVDLETSSREVNLQQPLHLWLIDHLHHVTVT